MQICVGKVITLHLYQGAFVDIGGVYDGYLPIPVFVFLVLLKSILCRVFISSLFRMLG